MFNSARQLQEAAVHVHKETGMDDFESQYAEELEMMKEEDGECPCIARCLALPPSLIIILLLLNTLNVLPSLPRGNSYGSTFSPSLGPAQPLSAFEKEAFARKPAAHGDLRP